MNNETLWANYAQCIAQGAGLGAAPSNLVLTGTSRVANLAVGSTSLPTIPTVDEALFQIYTMGDTLAFEKFVYDSSNESFFSNYATYIDNLTPQNAKPPSPTDTAKIKGIKAKLNAAQATTTADMAKAFAAWKTDGEMFPGKYPTFSAFLAGTPWGSTINTDQNAESAQNSALSTIMTSVYGSDYVAIQNAKAIVDGVRSSLTLPTASTSASMVVQATSGKLVVPTYNSSALNNLGSWVDGMIAAHTPQPASAQAISVNGATGGGSAAFASSSYYNHTDFSSGFWFFRAGGSVTNSGSASTVDTTSSSFDVTFGFDGIKIVDITRGPWYDSSLMYDYPGKGLSSPTQLIVGMYPQIEMKMDAASYASAQSAYNSSSGFGAGIWWASASSQHNQSGANFNATWNNSSNSVTIAPAGVQPVVLGMMVTPNVAS